MNDFQQPHGDGDGLARTILASARSLLARWRRRNRAAATYFALRELDARTLRDLGVDRSELLSVAAEIAGGAEPTRVITRYY